MAMTANGLTPCPGGDCHGIDHAWCAPGRHAGRYRPTLDALLAGKRELGKHRRERTPAEHRAEVAP